jgi:hypothetical protein
MNRSINPFLASSAWSQGMKQVASSLQNLEDDWTLSKTAIRMKGLARSIMPGGELPSWTDAWPVIHCVSS